MLAAIDLGSNSFHMVVARLVHDEIRTLDKLGEKVQLAAGLDSRNHLDEEAQQRGLECLSRFAQRLQGVPRENIQVVGTNALRVARNAREFIQRARQILGAPVEVIAGREEARLVYLGVSHTLADDHGRRLVIDIGGGSTEFIIGERFEAQEMESLHMGCVSFRDRYFRYGQLSRKALKKAVTHAGQEILYIQRRYRDLGWNNCVGSSGTVKAIAQAAETLGLSRSGITRDAMKQMYERMQNMKHVEELEDWGVKAERQSIFPSGFAILYAAFEFLAIDQMDFATGALREGLLYDTLGRIKHEDVRERTLLALQERYQVDRGHAAAVEATAIALLDQVRKAWGLDTAYDENLLRWACQIHEIGLAISHSQYHKHGAYLLRYSDLPGFSRENQETLALLVRVHRRKFNVGVFEGLPGEHRLKLVRLALILRLAVLFQHARAQQPPPPFRAKAEKGGLELEFDDDWLDEHPLTKADLKNERDYQEKAGLTLTLA
ncbi:exopolyphosphatase [Marinobacteraceae bacterium S3BR75-40.1]